MTQVGDIEINESWVGRVKKKYRQMKKSRTRNSRQKDKYPSKTISLGRGLMVLRWSKSMGDPGEGKRKEPEYSIPGSQTAEMNRDDAVKDARRAKCKTVQKLKPSWAC